MNIKRFINQNNKSILHILLIVVAILIVIKTLNSIYEQYGERKKAEIIQNEKNKNNEFYTQYDNTSSSIENNTIEKTINSFVNYCNNRELENAYKILTQECKENMYPTVDFFKTAYIDKIYNVRRLYEMTKWSTNENKTTYLVTLYEDILATGGTNNSTQEYWTFIQEENGNYKLNINNYIYRQEINAEKSNNNVKVTVQNVDIYQEYEEFNIKITNDTSKTICLSGFQYNNNIYLENDDKKYQSINSGFDRGEEILLESSQTQTLNVRFNKMYTPNDIGEKITIKNIILDYDAYLNSGDLARYSNKTTITVGM